MKLNSPELNKLKLLLMISAGGMLEAYDFIVYGLLTAYISPLFFPHYEVQQSLLIAFAIFAVGYLSRPLGGFIFGHQGDRHGRKHPLTMTLLLMAFATVSIGLLPDYYSAGIWSPILLITLRFIQGLSMGGEVGGVYTYISEVFEDNKGLAIAIIASGMELGILLGQVVHSCLIRVLGTQGMVDFGWRIPFLIGGILGIVGYIIRKNALESGAFIRIKNLNRIARLPVRDLLRYPWHCLCGTLLTCMLSISFLIFLVYIPSTLMVIDHPAGTPVTGCYMVMATVVANLFLAFWLDTQSHKLMSMTITGLVLLGPTLVWFIFNTDNHVIPLILLCGLVTSLSSVVPLFHLTSLFPTQVRFTGISITYGLGFAVGGTTPATATWLSSELSHPWASAYLLMTAGVMGFVACMMLRN